MTNIPPPVGAAQRSRLDELAEELGEEIVQEIILTFLEEAQGHLVKMRAAAARNDGDDIFCTAHSLAGAAQNVGATDLASLAAALQTDIGSLGSAEIDAALSRLETGFDASRTALKARS